MTTPTPGSMRAAEALYGIDFAFITKEQFAAIIDENTGAAAMLDALKRAQAASSYCTAEDIATKLEEAIPEINAAIASAEKGRQQ